MQNSSFPLLHCGYARWTLTGTERYNRMLLLGHKHTNSLWSAMFLTTNCTILYCWSHVTCTSLLKLCDLNKTTSVLGVVVHFLTFYQSDFNFYTKTDEHVTQNILLKEIKAKSLIENLMGEGLQVSLIYYIRLTNFLSLFSRNRIQFIVKSFQNLMKFRLKFKPSWTSPEWHSIIHRSESYKKNFSMFWKKNWIQKLFYWKKREDNAVA